MDKRALRALIREAIREKFLNEGDVVQMATMSSDVDDAIKATLNAAATEIRDLEPETFKKLAGNKQGISAAKSAILKALRDALAQAVQVAPAAQQQKPSAPPAKPAQAPQQPTKQQSHSGTVAPKKF